MGLENGVTYRGECFELRICEVRSCIRVVQVDHDEGGVNSNRIHIGLILRLISLGRLISVSPRFDSRLSVKTFSLEASTSIPSFRHSVVHNEPR